MAKNYKRVRKHLEKLPVGARFTAQTIAKACNLTGADVGNILKCEDGVRNNGRVHGGNVSEWEKVPV